jgi:hypothetical protein
VAVSLSVSGRLSTPEQLRDVLAFAARRAVEWEWHAAEVRRDFPSAAVRDGARVRPAAPFRARGLALRPHFACDPLSLVFADDDLALVDLFVHEGDGVRTIETGCLLNTQFAGPVVHREICGFLADLAAETGCTLEVDDESGWFATREDEALAATFAAAWRGVRARIRTDALAPGTPFEVGELPFFAPDGVRRAEFAAVPADLARRIEELELALAAQWADFGLRFDRSAASVVDLELAASDFADPETGLASTEAAREEAANVLGAAFGRAIIAQLGGHWFFADEEGLQIRDVGGVGLAVDPIVAAWDRLESGPVHSLTNHFATYAAVARGLSDDAASAGPATR